MESTDFSCVKNVTKEAWALILNSLQVAVEVIKSCPDGVPPVEHQTVITKKMKEIVEHLT